MSTVFETHIDIRWRDMDAFGHVNNAVYLTYLEEARDGLLEHALGVAGEAWNFVVARIAIDFSKPLRQADGSIVTRCRLHSIGRSSFRTMEEIVAPDGTIAARAETTMVAIDSSSGRARPLTQEERAALEGA